MPLEFLTKRKILLISTESFDHIPVSKHHYAEALAAAGNDVYFLNPPTTLETVSEHKKNSGLYVVNYRTIRGLNKMPEFLRNFFNAQLIRKIEKLCQTKFDVVWTFDPFRFQNLSLFRSARLKLFHAVDVHVAPLEQELVRTCDVILAVSEKILKLYSTSGKICMKIGHGLVSHFFREAPAVKNSGQIKVGYIGNLDNWCIDKSTLLKIVEKHPQLKFYFIGPYASNSELANQLKTMPQCTLLGKIPSDKLPEYLYQCDLFLMSYDGDNIAVNSNHHKILEYLATGKPAVINFTDEYKDTEDLVVMARKNSELPELFHQVVTSLPAYSTQVLQEKRIAFARSNSYSNHLSTIDKILANFNHAVAPSHSKQG